MKTKWPERVPILKAEDMCQEQEDGKGRGCLVEWCYRIFKDDKANDVAVEACRKAAELSRYDAFVEWIKDKSPDEIAAAWNKAMKKLGYTVPAGTMEI